MTSRSASDLLRDLGVTEPHEIDVDAIALDREAQVIYRDLVGCEARLLGNGDHAIISVNRSSSRPRQRFSVAHELGHWMADRGRVSFLCAKEQMNGGRSWSIRENGANAFAADLLMPEFMFRPCVAGREVTLDTAQEMAGLFTTSLRATALRLVQLGPKPSIIVVTAGGKRDWFRRGAEVPDAFWPHVDVQKGSGADRLLRTRERRTQPTSVRADLWIEVEGADNYEIVEHSVRVSETEVVTLLWWQDESQITDFMDSE